MRNHCLHCDAELRGSVLDLGELPPCNRFESGRGAPPPRLRLAVTRCSVCGTVQLDPLAPPEELRPRVPWIAYNEPEAHLDAVVEALLPLIPTQVTSSLALGPFDAPLASRLAQRGIEASSVSLLGAVAASEPGTFPYLETYQASLTRGVTKPLNPLPGRPQLVICRYLLEHCHDPVEALRALSELATAEGVVVVEVPDCSKFLAAHDYSFLWEEHVSYFTEQTLTALLLRSGCTILAMWRHPGQLEDALVALVRPRAGWQRWPAALPAMPAGAPDVFDAYAAAFSCVQAAHAAALAKERRLGRRVAVFGAGHQAIMFINALRLEKEIGVVVDDDPRKQGYCVPGTAIPIVSSQAMLADQRFGLCLLAVSPHAEAKVMARCAGFSARKGRFFSLFPGSGLGTLIDHRPCD